MAHVIPVTPQPEPASFDERVRKAGAKWFIDNGLVPKGPKPKGVKLPDYWGRCLNDLHAAYGGICAYLCVYIVKPVGGSTVEHFVPKSAALEHAYEWSNYRLASTKVNSRKRDYDDVLDPFEISPETFLLDLVSGKIYPNPISPLEEQEAAQATIDRMGLDDSEARAMRAQWFTDYLDKNISEDYLRRNSPFVWYEMVRQDLRRPEA